MALYKETVFGRDLRDQLYQLNEQLKYMFGNLTPEDNYSKDALQKYFENDEKIASLIFDVNGLDVSLKNFKKDTEAKFQVTDEAIKAKVSKGEVSSELSLEPGLVTLKSNRLVVESTNFKLKQNGDAIFSGDVVGASIICKDGEFEANDESVFIGGFYTFDTRYGKYLATQDQTTGMGDNDLYCFWTGWDGTGNVDNRDPEKVLRHYGCVLSPNEAYAQELYLNDPIFEGKTHYWGVGESIADIYDRLEALEAK
jgi:hypothetical protein